MGKLKYQLYAFPYDTEIEEWARRQTYHRINPRYILVYTQENKVLRQNSRYHIINEKETDVLTDSEKAWLLDCNIDIIAEESLKQQDDIIKNYSLKLERLEAELEKEAKRIGQGKG